MEVYPVPYVEHNLPLVLLSGLGEKPNESTARMPSPQPESGTRIKSTSPECHGERAGALLQQFLRLDGSNLAWNTQTLAAPPSAVKYSMRAIGRTHTLPPRKAAPSPQSATTEGVTSVPTKTELHSPLSPLSPGSPIFPDGLFTPQWITKHQRQVPCLFISFFEISAGDSSQDERIKTDINAIRTSLSRSGFKTRFTAVLISDRSIVQAPDLEERLSSIRRLTSLDTKTGLFFMPPMSSHNEIATFVQGMMTALQPLCIEHYRELTKHARRKKARGGPPPSASVHMGAGSQSLSTSGWNTRYEVKQGILAEFIQDMSAAERHFTAAIDELFSSEGVFEATASWSPKWEDARLLCDAIAVRTLRCQLWNSQTTGAVRSWINYKDRMRDLVDRRGKGSETFGWAAWEARWAECMAQLITRADLAVQRAPDGRADEDGDGAMMTFQSVPEKSYAASDRLPPLQLLHHSGYWLKLAAEGMRERRRRALNIPDEDRTPPGQSPASAVANRVRNYDCYLVPDPHEEFAYIHLSDIARLSSMAIEQFEVKGQGRMMERLKFDLAKDIAESQGPDRQSIEGGWAQNAQNILLPLWEESSWRQEEWHDLFGELTLLLHKCAMLRVNHAVMVATTYELLSRSPHESFDLANCLQLTETGPSERISLKYRDDERVSPVKVSFAFEDKETNVGEAAECQLTLASCSVRGSTVDLSDVVLHFGTSRKVTIRCAEGVPEQGDAKTLQDLKPTKEDSSLLEGEAYLSLQYAQQKTIAFRLPLREAGTLLLTEASFSIRTEAFDIEHTFTEETFLRAKSMLVLANQTVESRSLPHAETTVLTVLPKPPKVRIAMHGTQQAYYTDERVRLGIEIVNGELDAVSGIISADVRGDEQLPVGLSWGEDTDSQPATEFVERDLASLAADASQRFDLLVKLPPEPSEATLVLSVAYTLSGDAKTPLKKTLSINLSCTTPFDAQYTFGPVLFPRPWPSYFDANTLGGDDQLRSGIPQLWRLNSQLHSLATDELIIHETEVLEDRILNDSSCSIYESQEKAIESQTLPVDVPRDRAFEVHTVKNSLEDRRPTTLELSLLVTWSRDFNTLEAGMAKTSLSIPRLTLPVSEPRVLCSVVEESPPDVDAVLQYHIENPSTHFLTFALTMEASEDFAFSGPKYRTLSLAPLSRHCVEYNLTLYDDALPAQETGRWIWPSLQVVDSYYQKNLKVHPGGTNVKLDEKQMIEVWIDMA